MDAILRKGSTMLITLEKYLEIYAIWLWVYFRKVRLFHLPICFYSCFIITMKIERHDAFRSKWMWDNKVGINALMVKFQLFGFYAYHYNHICWLKMFPCIVAFIWKKGVLIWCLPLVGWYIPHDQGLKPVTCMWPLPLDEKNFIFDFSLFIGHDQGTMRISLKYPTLPNENCCVCLDLTCLPLWRGLLCVFSVFTKGFTGTYAWMMMYSLEDRWVCIVGNSARIVVSPMGFSFFVAGLSRWFMPWFWYSWRCKRSGRRLW